MRNTWRLLVASLITLAPALARAQAGSSSNWMAPAILYKLGAVTWILGAVGLICGLIGLLMTIIDRSKGLPNTMGHMIAFIILLPAYALLFLGIVWILVPMAQVVLLFLYLGVRRTRRATAAAKTTPAAPPTTPTAAV